MKTTRSHSGKTIVSVHFSLLVYRKVLLLYDKGSMNTNSLSENYYPAGLCVFVSAFFGVATFCFFAGDSSAVFPGDVG